MINNLLKYGDLGISPAGETLVCGSANASTMWRIALEQFLWCSSTMSHTRSQWKERGHGNSFKWRSKWFFRLKTHILQPTSPAHARFADKSPRHEHRDRMKGHSRKCHDVQLDSYIEHCHCITRIAFHVVHYLCNQYLQNIPICQQHGRSRPHPTVHASSPKLDDVEDCGLCSAKWRLGSY